MARKEDQRKRQKARERREAKRKEKRKELKKQGVLSAGSPFARSRAILKQSAQWPLYECLLSKDWQNTLNLTQILVARRSPQGQIAAGAFLVDLGCLGVKTAFARLFDSPREYQELRRQMTGQMPMKSADLNLVAKIIREAIAYARQFGFEPDPDYRDAMLVLGDADPDACPTPIPLGMDGKPIYIAGPYDNVRKIMGKLTRALGPDGFHYMVPLLGDEELTFGDEEGPGDAYEED